MTNKVNGFLFRKQVELPLRLK